MADVCHKQSFMIGLELGIQILVETDEVSLEELGDLPGLAEITESPTESVMGSCEDMVVAGGGSKQRKQLTACKNCHRKYSNSSLHKEHEKKCGKYANLFFFFFCTKCKLLWVTCVRL